MATACPDIAIRTALRFFRSMPIEIVGEAADAVTGLDLARRSTPDIVTVNIGLPDMTGIEMERRLKRELPDTHTIVVTAQNDRPHREEAIDAGAAFCLGKDNLVEELPSCLDFLMVGQSA